MLLTVANLRKEFAAEIVLDGLDLRVDRHEKVAFVGRNGAGKTTLLKILMGEYEPDGGSVNWAKGVSVGYLSQHSRLDETRTVLDEAQSAQAHLRDLETRLKELEALADAGLNPEELEEFSMLQEHFIAEGGYSVERDMRTVLARMGFGEEDYNKPVAKLSGGEKTRLTLAKLLLEEPELLILDEPTNHLDLEATEWLENWVKGYHGSVLLVSHDRMFLENAGQRVVELKDGKVKSYPGNFTKFLQLRAEEDARQADLADRQQQEMAKMDEFVRRFMNSQRTAQARGRLKLLTKLKEQAVEAPKADAGMKAGFAPLKRSGDQVLECEGLGMEFEDEKLFQNLNWGVRIKERWGVIGQNGVGKSTLLKILLGHLKPTSGRYMIGSNVEVGYFSQDAHNLDLNQSPILMLNERLGMEVGPARNLLGRFLFSGDDSMRPIRTLSGGERNKLQLAMLTAMKPNVLMLDEPTNHLDMPSREALAEVLKEFQGTLILVSHDRWLLSQVTSHTLDLRRDGHTTYPGPYPEYRAWREKGKPVLANAPTTASTEPAKPTMTPREVSKEIGRLEKELIKVEEEISKNEIALESLERIMAKPPADADHYAMSVNHGTLRKAIDSGLELWEQTGSRIEELRAMQGVGV
ncbi:MAG: ATP-binding cassette domain-containing protein [Armatimonadetes bacterium]|nr:ATP-binding cassette domain-containing protein [Armatimonadota bacterium]